MTRTLTINVDADCISSGTRSSGTSCPIALALKDAGLRDPYAEPDTLFFTLGAERAAIVAPHKASIFMVAFDAGLLVEPFSFTLTLPPEP